jgi:serine/threonine protein kinase
MIKKHEVRKDEMEKLIKELKIQTYLHHVNLVRLIHTAHDSHFLYVFYEPSMLAHHNLAEQIKDGGPLFEREVRRIIKQICSAVDYM